MISIKSLLFYFFILISASVFAETSNQISDNLKQDNICTTTNACSLNNNFDINLVNNKYAKDILNKNDIVLFYAYDCPHCHDAIKLFNSLIKKNTAIKIKKFEIKQNTKNIPLFKTICSCENILPQGVPVIFIRDKVFIGFNKGIKKSILKLLKTDKVKQKNIKQEVSVYIPFLGTTSLSSISLPIFSIYLGFLDGLNPCAMWVLVFLLSLMITSKSRKKLIFIGATFVIASGLVYFAFMTAWLNIFTVVGYSKLITILLGLVALIMGLINIKELFFFKKGVSLMIPESAKSRLYKKARYILNTKSFLLSILGTIVLALFVNFIELACTVGLPAVFTRVLSLKNISITDKYFYMGIYNLAYVVPLAIIVLIFIFTMERFVFKEIHGKILKLISGILMLSLGLIILFFPKLLF